MVRVILQACSNVANVLRRKMRMRTVLSSVVMAHEEGEFIRGELWRRAMVEEAAKHWRRRAMVASETRESAMVLAAFEVRGSMALAAFGMRMSVVLAAFEVRRRKSMVFAAFEMRRAVLTTFEVRRRGSTVSVASGMRRSAKALMGTGMNR